MKYTRLLLILFLAAGVMTSCSKIKESPEPSTTDSGGSGGGGGGNSGDPDIYIGLWKMTDKVVSGSSVYAVLDSIPEVKMDVAGAATWNWYKGGNLAYQIPGAQYSVDAGANPVTVLFKNPDYGTRIVVNKTGSVIEWKYNDAGFGGEEVTETFTKQ